MTIATRGRGATLTRVAALGALLVAVPGCAFTGQTGWESQPPDAVPRVHRGSARGPMFREGGFEVLGADLFAGAEVSWETDGGTRLHEAAGLVGLAFGQTELGSESPRLELALAPGLGYPTFRRGPEEPAFMLGARADAVIPIVGYPFASYSHMRTIFTRLDVVPYIATDVSPADAWGSVGAGLGLRLHVGTDLSFASMLDGLL